MDAAWSGIILCFRLIVALFWKHVYLEVICCVASNFWSHRVSKWSTKWKVCS